MGQKVHPNGMRVGVIRDWNTHWYASKKNFARGISPGMACVTAGAIIAYRISPICSALSLSINGLLLSFVNQVYK